MVFKDFAKSNLKHSRAYTNYVCSMCLIVFFCQCSVFLLCSVGVFHVPSLYASCLAFPSCVLVCVGFLDIYAPKQDPQTQKQRQTKPNAISLTKITKQEESSNIFPPNHTSRQNHLTLKNNKQTKNVHQLFTHQSPFQSLVRDAGPRLRWCHTRVATNESEYQTDCSTSFLFERFFKRWF